jgi:hypothetical protein
LWAAALTPRAEEAPPTFLDAAPHEASPAFGEVDIGAEGSQNELARRQAYAPPPLPRTPSPTPLPGFADEVPPTLPPLPENTIRADELPAGIDLNALLRELEERKRSGSE